MGADNDSNAAKRPSSAGYGKKSSNEEDNNDVGSNDADGYGGGEFRFSRE